VDQIGFCSVGGGRSLFVEVLARSDRSSQKKTHVSASLSPRWVRVLEIVPGPRSPGQGSCLAITLQNGRRSRCSPSGPVQITWDRPHAREQSSRWRSTQAIEEREPITARGKKSRSAARQRTETVWPRASACFDRPRLEIFCSRPGSMAPLLALSSMQKKHWID
jgi:hypothetical protein